MRDRVAAAIVLVLLHCPAARAAECKLEAIGAAEVRAVIDGRTVSLADGRELRLSGIEAAEGARPALEQAVLGRELALFRLGPDRDRYGRVVAVAALQGGATIEQSLQATLLAQGHARVTGNLDDIQCVGGLLKAEQSARAGGLGLWAQPHYVVRSAGNPEGILEARGRFAVVEGKVVSVREAGATIYVNFGRRWSDDFTVTVRKREERKFASSGLELKKLEGRNVRVRGVIEERGGPWIEAAHVGQIEIAEQK